MKIDFNKMSFEEGMLYFEKMLEGVRCCKNDTTYQAVNIWIIKEGKKYNIYFQGKLLNNTTWSTIFSFIQCESVKECFEKSQEKLEELSLAKVLEIDKSIEQMEEDKKALYAVIGES